MRQFRPFQMLSDRAGAALIEFALIAPMLVLLLLGGVELSRYVLISQKVEKAGYTLGDVLTQYTQSDIQNTSNFTALFNQYTTIMSPYAGTANQHVIFTSVTKDPADHKIKIDWQKSGGGTLTNSKTVSIVDGLNAAAITASNPKSGTAATFSGNSVITGQLMPGSASGMADGENMIVTEVFYQYKPMLAGALSKLGLKITPTTLVRRTFMRPRNGDLTAANCTGGTASWPPGCKGTYGVLTSGASTTLSNTAAGYTGSEKATCSNGSIIFSNASCTPTPKDGACGAANGGTFANATAVNSAGLCSAGSASPGSVSGNGPWSWKCTGSNGGTTASCSSNTSSCPSGQAYQWVLIEKEDMECTPGMKFFPTNPCQGSCDPGGLHTCTGQASCAMKGFYQCKCAATSAAPVCGSVNGTYVGQYVSGSLPAKLLDPQNLCSGGTTSTPTLGKNGLYSWTCSQGSSSVSCSASICQGGVTVAYQRSVCTYHFNQCNQGHVCGAEPKEGACYDPATCSIACVQVTNTQEACPNGYGFCRSPTGALPCH